MRRKVAIFLFPRLPIRRAKTNTFLNRGRLDEKQTEEQKGSFDSERESSWERRPPGGS
jgi:hypothetical protein